LSLKSPGDVKSSVATDSVRGFGYPRSGDDISRSTFIEKPRVVAMLRSRGLHGRADWVDREFSGFIDVEKNASLLRTLGIDAAAMASETQPDRAVTSATGVPVPHPPTNG
jgi:hypothetical protein